MLRIAITGGIGTGKTAVTDFLRLLGYDVIDADEIAHALTCPGGRSIPYILDNFGDDYLLPDGGLNRKKMSDLVFGDPEKLALLERGTTDIVIDEINDALMKKKFAGARFAFAAIPLLFEKNLQDDYNFVWLVRADEELRIRRLCKRDNISSADAEKIISNQLDEDYKESLSDEIIDNSGSFEELYSKVRELLRKYDLQLSD